MARMQPRYESAAEQVLAVVDWNVDPGAVIQDLEQRAGGRPSVFRLLVPARLALLDWIGNPKASCPCATRQIDELTKLGADAGLEIVTAATGDPERVSTARSALETWRADRVLLFERTRPRLIERVSFENRLRRSTGLPVEVIDSPLREPIATGASGRSRPPARCTIASA